MVIVPDGDLRMPVSTTSADSSVAATRDAVTVPIEASPLTLAVLLAIVLDVTVPFTAARPRPVSAATLPHPTAQRTVQIGADVDVPGMLRRPVRHGRRQGQPADRQSEETHH